MQATNKYLTTGDVAEMLRVKPDSARMWIWRHKIPRLSGNRRLVRRVDVERALSGRTVFVPEVGIKNKP
jgi:excisionase family DNA binding protein